PLARATRRLPGAVRLVGARPDQPARALPDRDRALSERDPRDLRGWPRGASRDAAGISSVARSVPRTPGCRGAPRRRSAYGREELPDRFGRAEFAVRVGRAAGPLMARALDRAELRGRAAGAVGGDLAARGRCRHAGRSLGAAAVELQE